MGKRSRSGTRAEDEVVTALRGQLSQDEILLTSVRITDPRDGDVEVDAVIFFPDLGAAVIEIKGGLVEYSDGEWTTSRGSYRRRIHPVAQARKAKHALRRYLDRQPEWTHPLLRTEWFVALPQTPVAGDLGPEGNRDHILGAGDVGKARERIRRVLGSTLNTEPIPTTGWEQDALALLLRSTPTAPPPRRKRPVLLLAGAAAAGVTIGVLWIATSNTPAPASQPDEITTGECHPNYQPCLPITDDLDCADIRVSVTVIGKDVYALDRDGDGQACEIYR